MDNRRVNKLRLGGLFLVSTLILAGCAAANPTARPTDTAEPSPSPTPKVFVTAPLTGIAFEQGAAGTETLSLPAVACKIDNAEAARPQYNLNKADIVFVEMVELA